MSVLGIKIGGKIISKDIFGEFSSLKGFNIWIHIYQNAADVTTRYSLRTEVRTEIIQI